MLAHKKRANKLIFHCLLKQKIVVFPFFRFNFFQQFRGTSPDSWDLRLCFFKRFVFELSENQKGAPVKKKSMYIFFVCSNNCKMDCIDFSKASLTPGQRQSLSYFSSRVIFWTGWEWLEWGFHELPLLLLLTSRPHALIAQIQQWAHSGLLESQDLAGVL